MISCSAPGKLILFGEHAVVYGQPALAVPVTQVQATVSVSENPRGGIWIDAPAVGISASISNLPEQDPLAAVVSRVLTELGVSQPPDCVLSIHSTIPVASGLGSGAAVSVAMIRALSTYLGQPLPDARVSEIAFEVEKLHHGTPSGIDNTVITYAKPVYYVMHEPLETLSVGAPFTLVIADTGVSAPTKEAVGDVRKLWEAEPARMEGIFLDIGKIARQARHEIEAGNWMALGAMMNSNQSLLRQLTVSSKALDRLVEAALKAGALGAKLSGGGRGGNMIALVKPGQEETISEAMRSCGATHTLITRIE